MGLWKKYKTIEALHGLFCGIFLMLVIAMFYGGLYLSILVEAKKFSHVIFTLLFFGIIWIMMLLITIIGNLGDKLDKPKLKNSFGDKK